MICSKLQRVPKSSHASSSCVNLCAAAFGQSCFIYSLCSSRRRRLAAEDSRSGDSVLSSYQDISSLLHRIQHIKRGTLTLVGVVRNTGVSALVGTREADEVTGDSAAATGDLELVATRVELGTRVLPCALQGDGLMANEVVAGFQAGGDSIVISLTSYDLVL